MTKPSTLAVSLRLLCRLHGSPCSVHGPHHKVLYTLPSPLPRRCSWKLYLLPSPCPLASPLAPKKIPCRVSQLELSLMTRPCRMSPIAWPAVLPNIPPPPTNFPRKISPCQRPVHSRS